MLIFIFLQTADGDLTKLCSSSTAQLFYHCFSLSDALQKRGVYEQDKNAKSEEKVTLNKSKFLSMQKQCKTSLNKVLSA